MSEYNTKQQQDERCSSPGCSLPVQMSAVPTTTATATATITTTTTLQKKQKQPTTIAAQQQTKPLSTFKPQKSNQKRQPTNYQDRNSLESIQSRFSQSSTTNDESPVLHKQQHQQQPLDESSRSNSSTPAPIRDLLSRRHSLSISSEVVNVNINQVNDDVNITTCKDSGLGEGKRDKGQLLIGAFNEVEDKKNSDGRNHQHEHYLAIKSLGKQQQSNRKLQSFVNFNGKEDSSNVEDELPIQRVVAAKKSGRKLSLPAPPKNEKPPFPFAGILASILASVFFSTSTICVKLLPDSEGFEEKTKALFFRGALMSSICALAITCRGSNFTVPRDEIWINLLRSVFGTLGIFGTYCSLKYISPGDTTALVFSSPIWTSILSYFIFGEPLQWIQLLALPACLFGIVLIAHPALIVNVDHLAINLHHQHQHHNHQQHHHHNNNQHQLDINDNNNTATELPEGLQLLVESAPSPSSLGATLATSSAIGPQFEHRWPGIVIALCVSLMVSCVYIVLKFRKTTPIQTTTFWLGVFMSLTAIAVMSGIGFGGLPDTWREWSLLVGLGITSWLGQSCLQWAFFYEAAGLLAIVRTLDVAMTFIMSAIFLDEDIYWTSILGASIIGLVVVSVMLNNWISTMTCMNKLEAQVDATGSAVLEVAKELKSITGNSNTGSTRSMNGKKSVYTISKAA